MLLRKYMKKKRLFESNTDIVQGGFDLMLVKMANSERKLKDLFTWGVLLFKNT